MRPSVSGVVLALFVRPASRLPLGDECFWGLEGSRWKGRRGKGSSPPRNTGDIPPDGDRDQRQTGKPSCWFVSCLLRYQTWASKVVKTAHTSYFDFRREASASVQLAAICLEIPLVRHSGSAPLRALRQHAAASEHLGDP